MNDFFKGKAGIVTGASSGIGRAIARVLGKAGLDLWLVGRRAEQLQATADAIAGNADAGQVHCVALDIADPSALAQLVEEVGGQHPYLFALINNAAVMHPEPLLEIDAQRLHDMFNINLFAPIAACRAAVAVMRRHGRPGQLVNISSLAAREDRYGGYSVCKSALEHAGRALRRELEGDDIRVTNVAPGGFATELGRGFLPETAALLQQNIARSGIDLEGPAARRLMGDPVHVANVVEYVLRQPIELNFDYVSVRPAVNLDI